MSRSRRLKIIGEQAYYHLISRTVGQEYYLGEVEKERLLGIIRYYTSLYFVKVIGFSIMSNHFHLLVKSEPSEYYNEEEILSRVKRYTKWDIKKMGMNRIKSKLEDISEYMKSIKQSFSRWYNSKEGRSGYFWGDRFKSVLIEEGEGLLKCLAYIDLNPVRGKIVRSPEDYRWCSMSYREHRGGGSFLSFEGVYYSSGEELSEKEKEYNREYRKYINSYLDVEDEREGEIKVLRKVRYFTYGFVLGSRSYIEKIYSRYGGRVIKKKSRRAYRTGLGAGVYSMRYLS